MARILVAERLESEGVELLRAAGEVEERVGLDAQELLDRIEQFDALIVRSRTQVTADVVEAGNRLQVIGRAGVGVDNIDLEAATRKGIAVVNAPTGNTVAAAEHTGNRIGAGIGPKHTPGEPVRAPAGVGPRRLRRRGAA